MSCFFGHKWGNWEPFTKNVHLLAFVVHGKTDPYIERWQKRVCLLCGFTQEAKL